jgi:YesN/AraC family two-component response regulator
LSDLLRKETGQITQDHIHKYIIEKAKNKLLNSTESISEIAHLLGFEYPQYFSKILRKKHQENTRNNKVFRRLKRNVLKHIISTII